MSITDMYNEAFPEQGAGVTDADIAAEAQKAEIEEMAARIHTQLAVNGVPPSAQVTGAIDLALATNDTSGLAHVQEFIENAGNSVRAFVDANGTIDNLDNISPPIPPQFRDVAAHMVMAEKSGRGQPPNESAAEAQARVQEEAAQFNLMAANKEQEDQQLFGSLFPALAGGAATLGVVAMHNNGQNYDVQDFGMGTAGLAYAMDSGEVAMNAARTPYARDFERQVGEGQMLG